MTVRERNDRRRRETKKRQRSRSTAVTHMHAKRRTKQERALGGGKRVSKPTQGIESQQAVNALKTGLKKK
jgi:hypothetical protein